MKKILVTLLCLVMLASVFSGCQTDEPEASATKAPAKATDKPAEKATEAPMEEPEDITVSLWTLDSRVDGIDAVMDAYTAAYPNVTFEPAYNNAGAHRDGLRVSAASDTMPTFWFNWGGTLGGYYAENGLIKDLTDYAAENNWSEKIDSASLNLSTLHGQLAGFPVALNMVGVFYRKDITDGLGLETPTTLEEFEAFCAAIKDAGYVPMASAGGGDGYHVMRTVEQLIEHYAGPALHDQLSTFQESHVNDAVISAFGKFQEWVEMGYFNEGMVTASGGDAEPSLYPDVPTAIMTVEGPWGERNILNSETDTTRFGYFAFPSGSTSRMSGFVEMYQFSGSASDAEFEAAMGFMDIYYGDDAIFANPTYYKYPCPLTSIDVPAANVLTQAMIVDAANNGTFTITDQAFPTEVAATLFSVQDELALGSMTPEEAAQSLQDVIEQYIANK